ncbi:MAG: hypothetical protein ACRED5_17245, partial [Propylenella sp.]
MQRIAALAFAIIAAAGTAAADPFYGFFDYQKAGPPVGGDCAAISAAIGRDATWYGEFSGRRWDNFTDKYYPFAAFGCFDSEFDCRVWQNQAITYLDRGPMNYSTCRQGR